jgi:hypothetical protein
MARRAALVLALLLSAPAAAACPFCGVVSRPLSDRRDAALAVAVGEAAGAARTDEAGLLVQAVTVRQLLRGKGVAAGASVTARVAAPVEGTAILLCTGPVGAAGDIASSRWEAVAADEALLGYVAAAPSTDDRSAERLRWFAARLDHPDRRIADDAFAEFGLAPYEAVREAAAAIDAGWLEDCVSEAGGEQRRRGFCGLVLGIRAAAATDAAEARRMTALLRRAIELPASDVRAGFDGLLGGLLVAEGAEALRFFDDRGLFAPDARAGDARHLLAALRFAWESLAESVPRERTSAATARLLDNPVVAADAAVDLARYSAWDSVDRVAGLWDRLGKDDPLVRRGVVGYLRSCPRPEARAHLERLRAADPRAVAEAEAAARIR